MNMEHWWKDRDRVKLNYCTWSTTRNSTWIGLGYNLGLWSGSPDTNRLNNAVSMFHTNIFVGNLLFWLTLYININTNNNNNSSSISKKKLILNWLV